MLIMVLKYQNLMKENSRILECHEGYIILTVNGKKVKSPADVRQFTNNEKNLKSIEGILPDGTILNYQFGN